MPSRNNGAQRLALRIATLHGLPVLQALQPSKGYRNTSVPVLMRDGSLLNVMLYKNEPGILDVVRQTDAVSDFVAERGLPARHTLSKRIIAMRGDRLERYARVYNYLPGSTIPWEAYTRGHLLSLGSTLGQLHDLLRTYAPDHSLPSVESRYIAIAKRMDSYFSDSGVHHAMKLKLHLQIKPQTLTASTRLLELCMALPDRQVLHMDFVRGNILFDGQREDGHPRISGILDFEKAAVGHPIFDIARTLAFLLVDCKYKTSEQTTKYFLQSGYIKRSPMRLPQIPVRVSESESHDLLALLLDFCMLHDFYKFLRHNPYESLRHNEHYIRTRDILLNRGILAYA